MQDPCLYVYHLHTTEPAKTGEKDVQLQIRILQKGDGVPDASKMPSSGMHSSRCADPPFACPGNFNISTSVTGQLSQCGLSVPAGRRKQLFCSWMRSLTSSLADENSPFCLSHYLWLTAPSYRGSADTRCLVESEHPAPGAQPDKTLTADQLAAGRRTQHLGMLS